MNKMHHSSHALRIALLAGASVVALAAAAPSAGAADLNKPSLSKAPPPAPIAKDTWTWWIEGGAFNTAGDDINKNIPVVALKPKWGPEGAVGFDWRPFSPMHVIGQFRYGTSSKSQSFALSGASPSGGSSFKTAGSQSLREDHWLIDFGIGRDFGLGGSNALWTLGIRVADLRAKLTASGNFTATTFSGGGPVTPSTKNINKGGFNSVEKSSFVGAGPRFGVQGDIPLGNQWSIDWLAGAAVLFGERSLELSVTAAGIPFAANASNTTAIFNVDAQAGLSYWLSPSMKITASYRFDGYFKALKTLNATGGSGTSNIDRFYNGPMLRLTSTF
jgi:hypothetical protein